ncbi:outer membrane protein assembly factor BamC [uncultured Aquabacterium sp.]|uniref:outer membrane protein assembly factor BamC n=1 Tax=Aquabacterium sp. TaxID=1872578 RepID=UPI0025ECC530|nr:outer membrane protein assembly factor BamC [uncultured Aquabacterium sp.]
MSIQSRHPTTLALGATLSVALLTSGCSALDNALSGDKVDYKTSGAKTVRLDVPPDLSQLPGQTRYGQISTGPVSASSLARDTARAEAAVAPGAAVAPSTQGVVKLERQGQTRWLAVALPPEKVWDETEAFWDEMGFELTTNRRDIGLMETNWAENRRKVPEGGIRNLLGRVFEALYDSGERDQYRTRIERAANGTTEVYITHRGMTEEYVDARKEQTTWKARPSNPDLEAEMLSRLMARLGAPKEAVAAAKAEAAQPATSVAESKSAAIAALDASGTGLSVAADFDTSWRRVGLALDRSGFTVENRDRKQGFYEVRLSSTDPQAQKPGFFSRLFGSSKNEESLSRYRVEVSGQSRAQTLVRVTDEKGQATSTATARRIAKLLVDELN